MKEFSGGFQYNFNTTETLEFRVAVIKKGKYSHSETYSMWAGHSNSAYFHGLLEYDDDGIMQPKKFYDWKPIAGPKTKELVGGVQKVERYTFDDKYCYAHTLVGVYALPKYLYAGMESKEYILVCKREM